MNYQPTYCQPTPSDDLTYRMRPDTSGLTYMTSYRTNPNDDLTYRMRPDTSGVTNRTYNKYGPLNWSWTDFTVKQGSSKRVWLKVIRLLMIYVLGSSYGGRGERYSSPSLSSESPSVYRPVFNHHLTSHSEPSIFKESRWTSHKDKYIHHLDHSKSYTRWLFWQISVLVKTVILRARDNSAKSSSLSNSDFPFKKYRSDFTPFAPYKNIHDTGKESWQIHLPTFFFSQVHPKSRLVSFQTMGIQVQKSKVSKNWIIWWINQDFYLKVHVCPWGWEL